ncbi:MAG: hypothetical protein RSE48_01390 [Bacilli bacterium]
MEKKYKDLDFNEKKIASRMHAASSNQNRYSFPILIAIIIACYYISEYVNSYIVVPIIILAVTWYIAHEIQVKSWFDKNNIKITKKEIKLYGTELEIQKKLKELKDEKKLSKLKFKRKKKNI